MIILESANILGSYALKYPHVTRRPRANRISFLPCDNASSGVIGPRCVYIERISIAPKEFALALFDLSRASEWTKTRSAPILICIPLTALVLSNHPPLESRGAPLSQSACPTSSHHEYFPIFLSDAWYQTLIRFDIDKKWKYLK